MLYKIKTSAGVRAAAVILAVLLAGICAFTTTGAVYAWYMESDTSYPGGYSLEKVLVPEMLWRFDCRIMEHDTLTALQNTGKAGDQPAYAPVWKGLDDEYYEGKKSGNITISLYDYSDASVSYDSEGRGICEDPAYPDDDFYMYDRDPGLAFLMDAESLNSVRPIYTSWSFVEEDDQNDRTFAKYDMYVADVKIFRDGIPQDACTGRLLYSDKTASGDQAAPEEEDLTSGSGLTAAVMMKNGMVGYCSLAEPLTYMDDLWMFSFMDRSVMQFRQLMLPLAVLTGALFLTLLTFLIVTAGRYPCEMIPDPVGDGSGSIGTSPADAGEHAGSTGETVGTSEHCRSYLIRKRWIDRIPADLFIIMSALVIGGLFTGAGFLVYMALCIGITVSTGLQMLAAAVGLCIIAGTACIVFMMSFSVRVKLGKWWENTLCGMVIALFWRAVKKVLGNTLGRAFSVILSQTGAAVKSIGIQWKLALAAGAVMFFNIFACSIGFHFYNIVWIIMVFIADAAVMVLILITGLMMRRLEKGAENLAGGDLEAKVDTSRLLSSFRRHGENLNHISDGMSAAIEQRMKSERLKTELITNVSHDIKTPLTSIVSYVDLLDKEGLDGRAAEYVEVLKRQSARLKKLTADLVEASKAATGNISVDLRETDIRETVNQALGEYSERLEKSGLQILVSMPEEPVMAMADGRRLWRVLDNLLSNVCKYSLRGSRVYISVEEKRSEKEKTAGIVEISVKNISRDPLNIDAQDLLERFVRGDASRNSATEGSGLGLNIAKSLTELQGGSLELITDGDLFKVIVMLRSV